MQQFQSLKRLLFFYTLTLLIMLALYYAMMFFMLREDSQQHSKMVFSSLRHEVINNAAPTNYEIEKILTKPIFKEVSYQVILMQPSGQTYVYSHTQPEEPKFTTVTFPTMSTISNSAYQLTNHTLTGTIKLDSNYQLYLVLRHKSITINWISYQYWLPLMAAILLFIIALLYMFRRRNNWENLLQYAESLTSATKETYIPPPFVGSNTTPEFLSVGHALGRIGYQLHNSYRRINTLTHRLERLVNQSPLPMLMIMRQGQISFFNQRFEQVFTTSFQRDTKYSLTDFVTGSDKATQQLLQNLSAQRVSRTLLVYGLENKQAYQLHITPWFGEHGQIHGFTVLLNSIHNFVSQVEDLQQHNQQLERQINDFARLRSIIGHELRTPLNAIIGTLDLIEPQSLSAKQNEVLVTLTHSSQSMLTMLNDMLDKAKTNAGKTDIVSESTDIFKLGQQMSSLMVGNARRQSISLIYFFAPDCPRYIDTDNGRLRQILLNLLNNAVKFTSSGYVALVIEPLTHEQMSRLSLHADSRSTLHSKPLTHNNRLLNTTIKTNAHHHWIRFSVKDTGIGIVASEQPKLFSDFSQANEQINQNFGGTGLGLAISNSFAHLLGGFIHLDSDIDNGSTFALYLPCFAPTYQPVYHFYSSLTHIQLIAIVSHEICAEFLQRMCSHLSLPVSVYTQIDTVGAEQINSLLTQNSQNLTPILLVDYEYYESTKTLSHQHTVPTENLLLTNKVTTNSDDILDSLIKTSALPKILLSMKPERVISSMLLDQFDGFLNKPLDIVLLTSELIRLTHPAVKAKEQSDSVRDESEKHDVIEKQSLDKPLIGSLVLVVDDNITNQKITCKLLEKLGYRSVVADNGEHAIEQLQAHRQEMALVLMDCRMPVMDGLQATQAIRAKGDNIPIIALTANNTDDDRESCLSVGMNEFLAKPINKDKLQAVLKQFIS